MTINNELMIDVPDGFHVMSEEELSRFQFYDKPKWVISDPDRHMVVSVSWKKSGLASLLLKTGEVAKKMEAQIKKLMKPYGYVFHDYVKEDIGGIGADGFLYAYKAQGIDMCAESLSAKKGKTFYYIHVYMREELLEESRKTIKEMLQSAGWTV